MNENISDKILQISLKVKFEPRWQKGFADFSSHKSRHLGSRSTMKHMSRDPERNNGRACLFDRSRLFTADRRKYG